VSAPVANPVLRAAQLAWKPADMRPPWQWAEDNYMVPVSSIPGLWKSANSPWVKRPMEDLANNAIRQITVLCAAQAAKTETMLALLCWIVAEDPSPTMWVTSSDEEALKFCNERLMPALRLCPPVAKQIPDERTLAKSMEILFPTMMLECVGANSKAKLQSRSRRFLLLDEVRNWPDWALPMVMKRTRTWWNSRIVILTTPEKDHDTVHMQFLEGSQSRYHVPCQNPACGVKAELQFEFLKAEHPVTHRCVKWSEVPGARDAEGRWDLETLAPHLRYVCPTCGHLHPDTPRIRRAMAINGEWVSHNPKAPPHLVSYTWSAMLPTWVKWRSLVEEFIKAQHALEFGNHEPLKAFITESLGQPWEDRFRFAKADRYVDELVTDFTGPFVEARRFLSIDVQGKGGRHFYWSVHAFAKGGAQRIVAFGKAWSIEELRSIATDHKVEATNVLIDAGHWAAEVYTYVMESGVLPDGNYAWKAMKGDKAPHYLVNNVRMPFTWSFVDPYLGLKQQGQARPIRQILFSKSAMLDRAEAIMRGTGPRLEIPADADMLHDYKMQISAYERIDKEGTNGEIKTEWRQKRADDHWGSTFRQALVGAYATGLVELTDGAPKKS
jgi:phage terminase large subunit GpA-like protein